MYLYMYMVCVYVLVTSLFYICTSDAEFASDVHGTFTFHSDRLMFQGGDTTYMYASVNSTKKSPGHFDPLRLITGNDIRHSGWS